MLPLLQLCASLSSRSCKQLFLVGELRIKLICAGRQRHCQIAVSSVASALSTYEAFHLFLDHVNNFEAVLVQAAFEVDTTKSHISIARNCSSSVRKLLYARLLAHFVGWREISVDNILRGTRQVRVPLRFDAAL